MQLETLPVKSAKSEKTHFTREHARRAVEMARPLIEQAMLDKQFGDRASWDADYAGFARAKAETSWITRADNPKGAVCVDGIVVGASGAFERFDQAYAGAIAMCLRAVAG
jgi:hypothetical protein